MIDKVKTRFAPSPTGDLHIGGIRTALFAWLFARRHQGEFMLRIEDTDRRRTTDAATKVILEGMAWLGLDHARDVVYQSQRKEIYKTTIQRLLDKGQAYHCYCSKEELEAMRADAVSKGEKPRYNGKCRHGGQPAQPPPPLDDASSTANPFREIFNEDKVQPKSVVRFRNPLAGEVVIDDLIQGRVVIDNRELDDLIIARSDGSPTYNLTVVADDADMGITHVIRGDDHLNNTPRQVNIFKALGLTPPKYAHVPLILGPDGGKLSKRQGAASVLEYKNQGFLPEALLNYLVRLGWSHGDQEIFTLDEMIELFDIERVNKSAAALNPEKLAWLNQHYLRESAPEKIAGLLEAKLKELGVDVVGPTDPVELAKVQKERVKTIREMAEQSRLFYINFAAFDEAAAKKHLRPVVLEAMQHVKESLSRLEKWEKPAIHDVINSSAEKHAMKFGKIAQPLRVAVTGNTVSPSIDITLQLLGRDKVLSRLSRALEYIRRRLSAV